MRCGSTLVNSYGSVQHNLIHKVLNFFHAPSNVKDLLVKYFGSPFIRIITKCYASKLEGVGHRHDDERCPKNGDRRTAFP